MVEACRANAAAPLAMISATTLRYVDRSTRKIEQLIGNVDQQTHQPILSRTVARYQLQGTDLGYSFEHEDGSTRRTTGWPGRSSARAAAARGGSRRELDLYYALSTWNPYVVVLMSSRLQFSDSETLTTPHPRGAVH
jgi:hypothetical protein